MRSSTALPFLTACSALALVASPGANAQSRSAAFSNQSLTGGVIEVPYAPQLVPQSGITVEAWVTYDDTTLGTSVPYRWPTIVRTGINGIANAFNFRVDASNNNSRILKWTVNANTRGQVTWSFASGRLLQWTHVAGTYDGTTIRLLVDGVQVASAPLTGAIRDVGQTIRIGQGADQAAPDSEVWNGNIDEVRIWPFARTAGELTATKNLELSSVPGLVSTWNLDGNAMDSSSGQHGTLLGGAVWSTSAPAGLAQVVFPGLALGTSTAGCLGAIHATTTSIPSAGNLDFAFAAHRAPAGAQAIGLLALAPAASPLTLVGVQIWVDPLSLQGGFAVPVDALGTVRLPLPIPTGVPPGVPLCVQFGILDPCGPLGLTASDAIAVSTTP
ncbi:MAG: LamG domain-containing protein [Planctomycetes bacterium]|nr:LamG domain-containing protein [Planctomycetota bacterium]